MSQNLAPDPNAMVSIRNLHKSYGDNKVLKGVRALPVTAIVQYTFEKMNAYFLKYSMETDKQIAGENKENHKYRCHEMPQPVPGCRDF